MRLSVEKAAALLKNLFSLTEPFGLPSPEAVIRAIENQRVVKLSGFLQVIYQTANLDVRIPKKPRTSQPFD